jgi:polar amino acid transport system substrate-binding protein
MGANGDAMSSNNVILKTGRALCFALISQVVLLGLSTKVAQAAEPGEPLVVGVYPSPPFAMPKDNGAWEGISVDLWHTLALSLKRPFQLKVMEYDALIEAIGEGKVDVGIGSIVVTAHDEEYIDYSHAFFSTGLSIVTRQSGNDGLFASLTRIFSMRVMLPLLLLMGVLIGVGLVIWLFERRQNTDQFDSSMVKGVGSGMWWAAVTFTTVGYGDKAPVTAGGRAIGVVWMFLSLFIIAAFTGAISSAMTVQTMKSTVHGREDLARVRVGVVHGSPGEDYMRDHRMNSILYETLQEALQAVIDENVDAVVAEKSILSHVINEVYPEHLIVLPHTFGMNNHAFVFASESPLREPINRLLLKFIETNEWPETLHRYLGEY